MYKQPVGTSYRIIINKTVDVCGHFGGKPDILMQWFIDLIWKEMPMSLLHPCPYLGPFLLHNITIDMKILQKFPDGFYKVVMHFYNDDDPNIITVFTTFEVAGTGLKEF
ncbi:unnamed protein product [Chironomus riparius]|uniref:Uncharacterized protein n=1 Tax=Chironomus riparius TaxID=315576 RepID=A0A9N9S7T1_9DIPT|nr:unnamed protein product [Chironomus riparius]